MSRLAKLVSAYKYPTTGSLADNFAVLGRDVQSLGDTLQKGFGYFNSMIPMLIGMATLSQDSSPPAPRPTLPIYTMKQVRDAEDTNNACYQAIVRSEMTIDEVKDGGLLFDPLSGDPSGGVEIKLRNKENAYMNELLEMVSSGPDANGTHCVSPLVPFWEKVDLSYGLAERQSWRTKHTEWQQNSSAAPSGKGAALKKQYIVYDKRGSGSALAVAGDRKVDNAVLHVFMLHADSGELQKLVDGYLNKLAQRNEKDNPTFEFKVKRSYVYVMLLSYDGMTIGGQGSYGDTVLSFTVLTEYNHVDEDGNQGGRDHAFILLYTFVGTDWNFVTEHEVYGRLTFKSTMVSPEDAWVKQSAPGGVPHEVLSVSTTLFPRHPKGETASMNERKGTTEERVVAISSMPFPGPQSVDFDPNSADASKLLEEYGLAEYLKRTAGIPDTKSIALKQVRNAMHSEGADYQSLVAIERSFTLRGKGIKSRVTIRIYKLDGFPLLGNLGLNGKPGSVKNGDPEMFEEFEADALSFTGDLLEKQGHELWWRVAPQEVWTNGSGNFMRVEP